MLLLGPAPGISPYSVVPTASKGKPCQGHRPLCRKPWFDAYHRSLVRQENWQEGMRRYWVIARALSYVTEKDSKLGKLLLTVVLHESAARRDIHSCRGKLALGDEGRSYSLVQALLGRGSKKGWTLCGVGRTATERALGWGAGHLRRCAARGTPMQTFACYGGVSNGAKHKGIQARTKTYTRMVAAYDGSMPVECIIAEDDK
jgi:hypothetical protein